MATALSSLVTRVQYSLGLDLISTDTVPSSTEVIQWLKDAQRLMLTRLPSPHLGSKVRSIEAALTTTTTVDMSSYDGGIIINILSATFYDNSATAYYPVRLTDRGTFNYLKNVNIGLHDVAIEWDNVNETINITPAGQQTSDKLYLVFVEDLDTSNAYYELPEYTEQLAVDYACVKASLASQDLIGMSQKFFMQLQLGLQSLGG